jgi:hypothetical protein
LGSTFLEVETERLGALRASDVSNYIDTPALYEKTVEAAMAGVSSATQRLAGAAPSKSL